jgi:arylsulfatase A
MSSDTALGTIPNRPNIVWIMADDMGWGDLGCYGSEKIPTPNMDRIATEGIRFRDAHSSSAVCSPSRYSVLTGRYCWRTWMESGVLGGFGNPLIEPGRVTVASMLKQQGYATAAVGKWHLGFNWTTNSGDRMVPSENVLTGGDHEAGFDVDYSVPLGGGPRTLGFDYSFNISGSLDMPPFCFIENDKCVGVPDHEKEIYHPQQRPGLQVPGWQDEQVDVNFAQKAVEFIDGNTEEPFFLYLTPSSPHRPCVPPEFANGQSEAGKRGDSVWLFDWVVGQVLDALDRNGLADDTLIMVTSDNGGRLLGYDCIDYGHKTNGDWRGQKADIWEGGHREPFVARWPGSITPGSISDQTICLADFTATCADLMDVTLPDDAAEDSFSFLSVLFGADNPDAPIRPPVVHHSANGMFSIRDGEWKLVDGLGSGGFSDPKHEEPVPDGPTGQLYDLIRDPAEQNNVWNDHEDVVADLADKLRKYRSDGRSRPNA